eukprot:2723180-Amphidinium_carterae.1
MIHHQFSSSTIISIIIIINDSSSSSSSYVFVRTVLLLGFGWSGRWSTIFGFPVIPADPLGSLRQPSLMMQQTLHPLASGPHSQKENLGILDEQSRIENF